MTGETYGVWNGIVGQDEVVATLLSAANAARELLPEAGNNGDHRRESSSSMRTPDDHAMTHAWLITGPPGSGRSVAAAAFAAALQCTGEKPGCGECAGCRTTMIKTNADVAFVATEKMIIDVKTARGLVDLAQTSPSQGRWRVIIVEDADRLNEEGAAALLKAIEEPPERTVWLLCAPSTEDMLATIRSRCRRATLRIPPVEAVADLLVTEGIADPTVALEAARAAQSHIGLARALARDPEMRRRRREIITAPVRVRSVGEAVYAAEQLHKTAIDQAKAHTEERNAKEKAEALRQLGMDQDDQATKQSRAVLKDLAEEQKRREKRLINDELDRAMLDLMSIYRDVLMVQLGTGQTLINTDLAQTVEEIAADSQPAQTIQRISTIETARRRLIAHGNVLLVLEAMIVSLRPQLEE
ncbi:DNA polymerase III subunit delta' [Schaalia sp. ZJ1691]|uniref:DNA polymerase III subunit delta' n=1 Tax=Schaalia sp. ZJ1691 TaxID=2709404 RepID=UPI0013EC4039|nr:DNA polymerase III subunit delta' [Schaalia sp. ZJ1691]